MVNLHPGIEKNQPPGKQFEIHVNFHQLSHPNNLQLQQKSGTDSYTIGFMYDIYLHEWLIFMVSM